jgi:RNA polymerase sigma-70 factor (ECF subfamily)
MESESVEGSLISQSNQNFSEHELTSKLDDNFLVKATRVDPQAFEAIYQKYFPAIYRYLCIRGETPEDAADLTQQVFIKAFTNFSSYQERGLPLSAWLFRIARNCATDNYRRKRKTVIWDKLIEQTFPSDNQNPEQSFLRNEELQRMKELFSQLKPDKRELIAFRFAAGLTAKEIATIIGKFGTGQFLTKE